MGVGVIILQPHPHLLDAHNGHISYVLFMGFFLWQHKKD